MTRSKSLIAASVLTLGLATGCTNMNDTQQSTLSGGAIGAGVGAAGTLMTGGCVSCGAAIGAGVGAAAGYVKEKLEEKEE
ncbi:YMGG-like glycine zipper-containing protein [Hwanghaeella sp.]|uniref:YMGG-like glycine zipper-containing protein n=1 Tax=Hwanghaeella sp. TaxID=2605943 RepID=UPI003CCBBD09